MDRFEVVPFLDEYGAKHMSQQFFEINIYIYIFVRGESNLFARGVTFDEILLVRDDWTQGEIYLLKPIVCI